MSSRLTADEVKNLSALSGVAYTKFGAILTSLTAPKPAPKVNGAHSVATLTPTLSGRPSERLLAGTCILGDSYAILEIPNSADEVD
jgi:hypothetical protein